MMIMIPKAPNIQVMVRMMNANTNCSSKGVIAQTLFK